MTTTKCNGLTTPHSQPAENLTKCAADFKPSSRFNGTDNPRMLRVINSLIVRPLPREAVDSIAGAANGPDLISEIRDLFLPKSDNRDAHINCTRIHFIDRDKRPCRPGVYSLTALGRRLIQQWLSTRQTGGVA